MGRTASQESSKFSALAELGPVLRALFLFAAAGLVAACGGSTLQPTDRDLRDAADTGRTVEPRTPAEREMLSRLEQISADSPTVIGNQVVTAGPPYHAASARICRSLTVQQKGREGAASRLACTDGKAWFFVPDVLGAAAPVN